MVVSLPAISDTRAIVGQRRCREYRGHRQSEIMRFFVAFAKARRTIESLLHRKRNQACRSAPQVRPFRQAALLEASPMRRSMFFLPVVALLTASSSVWAQDIKSPADVMPAKTLVYGELRHVGRLGQEIAALFAGSALSNVPESLHKIRSKYEKALTGGRWRDTEMLGAMGLVFAPEVVKELERIHGAAASFTGMGKDGEPEFIVVVLPGESNAPGFFFRLMLTMAPMRPVGKCEEVTLYRISYRYFRSGKTKDGKRGKDIEEVREYGPLFAMMPNALLIGSPDNIKETIRRIKGKADGPSLGQSK